MKLDDFESVFRSAVKDRFHLKPPELGSVALVTDLTESEATALAETVRASMSLSVDTEKLAWRNILGGEYEDIDTLIALIESTDADLIVTYRHLLRPYKELPHSLGSFVDTITQTCKQPVLLLPPPTRQDFEARMKKFENVLVVTGHIIGDERLISWGVHACPRNGTIVLAHVEDDTTYKRYVELLSMIPDFHTETAVRRLTDKLLGRPRDYIQSIIDALEKEGIEENVIPVVTMGHALSDYKRIMDEHDVDLVVINTKDELQMAMHGMAYAIAVEIQDRPLLLL